MCEAEKYERVSLDPNKVPFDAKISNIKNGTRLVVTSFCLICNNLHHPNLYTSHFREQAPYFL